MNPQLRIACLMVALWLLSSPGRAQAAGLARPNIILIVADDLGYGDVRCYNKNSKIATPNLDKMARSGMRYTDAHAPASDGTPSRYGILTGRYGWRSRLGHGTFSNGDKPLIPASRMTLASFLKTHKYATGALGEWGLGWDWPTRDGQRPAAGASPWSNVDFSLPIGGGPTALGFDSFLGVDLPDGPPYCFIQKDRTVGLPSETSGPEIRHAGPMVKGWKQNALLTELGHKTMRYIIDRSELKGAAPFFLYVALTAPHQPVLPGSLFRGKTRAGEYGDYVAQVDDIVGYVIDNLQRRNLTDNTLVIFTSSSGPDPSSDGVPGAYARIEQFEHASMGELRGVKGDAYEGGHRVPLLVVWPGWIYGNAINNDTVCHVDLLATVAHVLGGELPAEAGEDSYNLLTMLRSKRVETPARPATIHRSAKGTFAIRKGSWVLIDSPSGEESGEPEWFKKLRGYTDHKQPGELYDLQQDLPQRTNRYSENPEVVSELKSLLKKYIREGRSTVGKPQSNDLPVEQIESAGKPPRKGN